MESVGLVIFDGQVDGPIAQFTFSFGAVGAYMGYNHISPLGFLPGFRIAAALGGFLFMIPGMIIASVITSLLTSSTEKADGERLLQRVRSIVGATPEVPVAPSRRRATMGRGNRYRGYVR